MFAVVLLMNEFLQRSEYRGLFVIVVEVFVVGQYKNMSVELEK